MINKNLQKQFEKDFLEDDLGNNFIAIVKGQRINLDVYELLEWISGQLEPQVNQATCGYCKDCKFWDDENVECTKDIVWVLSQNSYLKINDLKTQRYFGCTQFESKLSG